MGREPRGGCRGASRARTLLFGAAAAQYVPTREGKVQGIVFLASYSAVDLSGTGMGCLTVHGDADGDVLHLPLSMRQRGDVISWEGHVAIYLGDDMIIDAYGPVGAHDMWPRGVPRGVLRFY